MYNLNDTIVSVATGPGGVIGIIRLSGTDSFNILKKISLPSRTFENPKPNITYMVKLVDEDKKLIDKVIVINYISPKSYTGENMVEIFCHNSPYIIRKILDLIIKHGARQAKPGEFSFRAFINNKIDLSQAEAINELIKSETEKEHQIAIKHIEGSLKKKLTEYKNTIIDLLSEIEVRIDDTYEEMGEINRDKFILEINRLTKHIDKLANTFHSSKFIKDGIKVAIVGAPNVGKSSLLNTILGWERAITSEIPGTTRDTIEEKIELNSVKVVFIDTAGIRDNTSDITEDKGIERTINSIKKADIILFLQDITEPNREENKLCERIIKENMKKDSRIIYVYTKSDLLKKTPESKKDFIIISSKTGYNIDKLINRITELEEQVIDSSVDELITSYRHYECLSNALKELNAVKKLVNEGELNNYEIIAEHLHYALESLEDITGKTTSKDILNNIFSKFCVGK